MSSDSALFSDNWNEPHVDTSGGYHLYVVDVVNGHETTYSFSGAPTFYKRVLTWPFSHENHIKYDVMNSKLVMVTRIRDSLGNSKYRVYYVCLDHDNLTFTTRLQITIPYGAYYASTLAISFSVDADKFCAKDHTPGLCSLLMFYTLEVPTLGASAFQAVARQRVAGCGCLAV